MFSPNPIRWDGFLLLKGTFQHGPIMDVRTGKDPSTEMDIPRYSFGVDFNWRKWEENVEGDQNIPIMNAMAQYYCNQYNNAPATTAGALQRIEVVYRRHANKPYGVPEEPLYDVHIWWYNCT
jgi:hypothetical protein